MNLKKKLGDNIDKYRWYKSKQWNCQFFSHPKYIHIMSLVYPNINWCCAHLGGKNKERQDFILERLGGNFFADDSFTFTDEHEVENLIPILEQYENINHGTDYFMTKTKTEYVNQIEIYNQMIPQNLKRKTRGIFKQIPQDILIKQIPQETLISSLKSDSLQFYRYVLLLPFFCFVCRISDSILRDLAIVQKFVFQEIRLLLILCNHC